MSIPCIHFESDWFNTLLDPTLLSAPLRGFTIPPIVMGECIVM